MSTKRVWMLSLVIGLVVIIVGSQELLLGRVALAWQGSPSATGDRFWAEIRKVTPQQLPYTLKPGCPVTAADLRLLAMTHRTFTGGTARGEMVVDRQWAQRIVDVFHRLYDAHFPIERMELVDKYQGDDDRSMAANNTSAFNCRELPGQPGVWSQHAYGRAIDVNTVQNPYIDPAGKVAPPVGRAYLDRSRPVPGMIHAGDATVRAFRDIGWYWGGYWSDRKDYQHFSWNNH